MNWVALEVAEEVVYEDDANQTYTDQAMEEMAAAQH